MDYLWNVAFDETMFNGYDIVTRAGGFSIAYSCNEERLVRDWIKNA